MKICNIKSFFVLLYFLVLLFQVFRNLSHFYFIVLALAIILVLSISIMNGAVVIRSGQSFDLYLLFLFITIWVCTWSFIYNPSVDLPNTIGRLFFITSLPLILISFNVAEGTIKRAMRLYVYAYFIAALSYFFQVQYGPVEWFNDEPMERGTVFRYSTTLGSGNIYGIGLGVALLFASTLELNRIFKAVIIFTLLLGAIMSMQKASVLNILIWIALYVMIFNKKQALLIVSLSSLVVFFISAFFYINIDSILSLYFQEFIFNSIGLNLFGNPDLVKSTVLDSENLLERLVGVNIPEILSSHNLLTLFLLGIGTTGAGGGMGMPEYPQSHSTYWDLLFMGGFFYLFVYVALLLSVLNNLNKIKTKVSRILFWAIIIYSINSIAATTAVFHPILSFPVWLALIMVSNKHRVTHSNEINQSDRKSNLLVTN